MLAAPPAGVTATASATSAAGNATISGYEAGVFHTAHLTLTYGDDSVQTQEQFEGTWDGAVTRPSRWPADAVWWVAVSVDDDPDAYAAARVPQDCRRPRAPQLFGTPGPGRVALSWFQPATVPVTDYVIERSLNGSSWITVDDGISTAHSYTVTGLTNNVNHYFRVAAVGANGTGDFSFTVIYKPSALPTAPRAVTATAGPLSLVVRWQAPASGAPISYYRIQYSTDRLVWTERFASSTPVATRITGLTQGRRYYVRVLAVNGAGAGPVSALANTVPLAASRPLAPFAVALYRAQTDGDAFISVYPDYDGGRTIIKATVRCTSSNGGITRTGTATGLFPNYVLVAGLTKLKTYRCTGTLANRLGTGPAKASAAFVMPVTPAAPRAVTVSLAGGVTVRFTKPTGPNPISSYVATCTSSNGGTTASNSIAGSSPASIRITFGLTPGKRYTCRVQAYNAVGAGPLSAASAAFTAP